MPSTTVLSFCIDVVLTLSILVLSHQTYTCIHLNTEYDLLIVRTKRIISCDCMRMFKGSDVIACYRFAAMLSYSGCTLSHTDLSVIWHRFSTGATDRFAYKESYSCTNWFGDSYYCLFSYWTILVKSWRTKLPLIILRWLSSLVNAQCVRFSKD